MQSLEDEQRRSWKMATGGDNGLPVPMVHDTLTFQGRQAMRLKEMEKRIEEEVRKKKKDWEREVEKMREEFLHLYPSERQWGSEELLNDPLVCKRRGSTDILDAKKMKTLFLEYPDTGRRYKIRFDVSGFDPKNVKVSTDGERIVVKATRMEDIDGSGKKSLREYNRKIERPKEVDSSKLKSFLTCDGVLIVEAPLPPRSLSLRKLSHSPSHSSQGSHASSRSRSPSNSPRTPSSMPKVGVPTFQDINGERRLCLILEIGNTFKPKDITVQIIKENRIQVKAKHEERTSERLSKSKFFKEFELTEKIEPFSVRGGLTDVGKLMIGAMAKGHFQGTKKDAGETVALDINDKSTPCNVLDLASFPPTNVALGKDPPPPPQSNSNSPIPPSQ